MKSKILIQREKLGKYCKTDILNIVEVGKIHKHTHRYCDFLSVKELFQLKCYEAKENNRNQTYDSGFLREQNTMTMCKTTSSPSRNTKTYFVPVIFAPLLCAFYSDFWLTENSTFCNNWTITICPILPYCTQ